ncbi:MAG: flippase-like domain-containing protein [Anaerolineales bacterium]|nr:flippase-like domain-containing protein [Anaerolineales bacterium]
MRKFLIAVAFLLGILYIIGRSAELEKVIETLRRGNVWFILLGIIAALLWLINIAASYWSIYKALKIKENLFRLFIMSLSATFVNTIAPMAGMGGITIFITEARRQNYSSGKAMVAGALYVLFDYLGLFFVLTFGFIVLLRRGKMQTTEIVAAILLLLLAILLASFLLLTLHSTKQLGDVLAWGARLINRIFWPFLHRHVLDTNKAYDFAYEIAEGIQGLRNDSKGLLYPGLLALSNKILLIIVFFLMFIAFKVPVSIGTVIAGFSIGYLFLIISPTPSGVGFVEGAMTLVLKSFYIPLSDAAVITIAYRGITFWMPLFLGLLAFRWFDKVSQPEPSV